MNKKIMLKNFRLIDGNGDTPIENAYLIINGEKISSIGSLDESKLELESKSNIEIINLEGKTIMPGIINSHVHILYEPVGDLDAFLSLESGATILLRGVANLRKHLYSGTTFFRNLGAPDDLDIKLRDAVNNGIIEGPQLLASGKFITMTGGHGWLTGREADGPYETRKAAREQLKAGADLLKVMATGGVTTIGVKPGSPQLSIEEMRAAVEEAHKIGKKVAAHAQGAIGIKNAILAGVDSIEHGIFLDDETIELMLEKDVYLVPTLAAPFFIIKNGVKAGIPQETVDKTSYVKDIHYESFRKAYEAGVKIAMGNDSGTPFNLHDGVAFELKLMLENGMTPMETIVASTKRSADLLGILENYGTLEKGKFADFIILNENPLENLDTLFNIHSVYKLGKRVQ